MGGESTPSGICFLDILVSSKGEWGGAPKLTLRRPPQKKASSHTENTAAVRHTKKTFYCLKRNRGLPDMGNLKLNTTPVTAICS